MKQTLITLGLGLISSMLIGGANADTLRLKVIPERDYLLSGSSHEVVFKIDLTAIPSARQRHRTPLNIAVVLDRSGSMTGAKLEKAKQAAMGVVDQLSAHDIFSLITYSSDAIVEIAAQKVEDKVALKNKIERLRAGGSTALYAGVSLGAEQVKRSLDDRRINRVILLSDGLANVGPSSTGDLKRLGANLSEKGIAVTTIGVGDDYNEDLMAGLAEASDANYYYVKDTERLPLIFAKELGELLTIAAREITIEITCPEHVKPIGFLGRPEQFVNQRATARLSSLTAEQNRFLFLKCLVPDGVKEVAQVKVAYQDELDDGRQKVLADTARIDFSQDASLVANSLNAHVVTHKELVSNAVAKDEALAEADAGRYSAAADKLARQVKVLQQQEAQAPAAMQGELRLEIENLKQYSDQLRNNQYDSGSRKALQSQSWTYRNAK